MIQWKTYHNPLSIQNQWRSTERPYVAKSIKIFKSHDHIQKSGPHLKNWARFDNFGNLIVRLTCPTKIKITCSIFKTQTQSHLYEFEKLCLWFSIIGSPTTFWMTWFFQKKSSSQFKKLRLFFCDHHLYFVDFVNGNKQWKF